MCVSISNNSGFFVCKLAVRGDECLKTAINTLSGDPRYNVIFADTLTILFEAIARTVEVHQPLIETYYGPGQVAKGEVD